MEVIVAAQGMIKLEDGYNPIILEAANGDTITIAARDEGFELVLVAGGKEQVPSYYRSFGDEITPLFAEGA